MYYKIIENNYIQAISTTSGTNEITDKEYYNLLEMIITKPKADPGYKAVLRNDTLKWEFIEAPEAPVEENAEESDYIEALNTLGVDTNEEN